MTKEEKSWTKYRDLLISGRQATQTNCDRIIVMLSGGGMAILLWFMLNKSDIVVPPCLLVCAWLSWGCSLIAVIVSHFTEILAFEEAIRQVDYDRESLYEEAGGYLAVVTIWLNYASVSLFILGLIAMGVFVVANIH